MKKTWFAILAITLIAFLLRVYRLDFVSLRGDEAFTVIFVQRTWDGLWKGIRTIEPNPPLMYLVLRVWIALVGAGEFVTRYFSAFFGVLCVPLLYRLAREMFSYTRTRRTIGGEAAALPGQRAFGFVRSDGTAVALIGAGLFAIN
ncbi:MAG TPA: glycosyltransferase family 39 protein, partial [Anaerolineae bacterium]